MKKAARLGFTLLTVTASSILSTVLAYATVNSSVNFTALGSLIGVLGLIVSIAEPQ